jgi:glycosyltransferase involved in cell wall biosynthesis/SAM-dependent methyltransferase
MNSPGEQHNQLPWGGERPAEAGGLVELEHLHRYALAATLVRDKRVLDIASGEGYGSDALALLARHVIGVDMAPETVAHARSRYGRPNLEFRVGSAADIPVADRSVDAVISFATIERHDQHERMLEEIKRVLVPGGLLVMSSPNRRFHSVVPRRFHPHHVKELFTDEFERLLRERFANIGLFGQRVVFASLVVPQTPGATGFRSLTRAAEEDGLARPTFDLALASDDTLPHLPASLFEIPVEGSDPAGYLTGRIEALGSMVAERDTRIANSDKRNSVLQQSAREREAQLAAARQKLEERDRQVATLKQELAAREAASASAIAERDAQIREIRGELDLVLGSRSWRATVPLRLLSEAARNGPETLERIANRVPVVRGRRLRSLLNRIRSSPLFDPEYYLRTNPDVRDSGADPALHYLVQGWKELRDPSPAFSTSQYLHDNPDVARSGVNPLAHYLNEGQHEQRSISPSTASTRTGARLIGSGPGPRPAAAIDEEVRVIRASGLFDESYYRAMHVDIQPPPEDPIRHYCERGWEEGRNPSDEFDTRFYLETYSDIRAVGMNPLYHYVIAGGSELRHALPDLATHYENDIWFGIGASDVKLFAFYVTPDWPALRSRRPMFKGHSPLPPPHEVLGFYDPNDWRVLQRQARMAKHHGLHGFCFELAAGAEAGPSQPVQSFLEHGEIDFQFCVKVSPATDAALDSLVAALARTVADRRYARIGNRPIVVVAVPDAAGFADQLRQRLEESGHPNPFLIVQGDPTGRALHSDATLDLPRAPIPGETGDFVPRDKKGVDVVPYGVVASQGVGRALKAQQCPHPVYPVVTLGRSTTAPRSGRPVVYSRFHIRHYRRWLDAAIAAARAAHAEDRRFVFVNAWNDWSEGLFLEPDRQGGFSRLNETTRALLDMKSDTRMPKVSVIVPNYNHEPFLRRRLDSIYRQTYPNIEVILLDDCSSDGSRFVLEEYAELHPEITRVFHNEANSGSAFRQWAKGIKAATGDLVWIAESDDYCDERFLEVLVRCFDDEAVLLAYARSAFVDRHGHPIRDDFEQYLSDLPCAARWQAPYVETAHEEVITALGTKNTIPNASGVLFKRPIDMPLLDDPSWLTMSVAGDWVFYLHVLRGGKIAYTTGTTNYFRRYEGSTAETTYRKEVYFREVGLASRTVASLYNVPLEVLERCRRQYRTVYASKVGGNEEDFWQWYDYASILRARDRRVPNIMISTMGFYPGGAEILPIRLANEFKRRGLSVLLLSAGLNPREDGVRRMVRNDVPVVETSSIEDTRTIIHEFGVECLNTHQWYMQKYPAQVPDVFDELRAHVASLHGMIEYGNAFRVTEEELRAADARVTTWIYTAQKNLGPFIEVGLYDESSPRFMKIPNGMQPPEVLPIPRVDMDIPEQAFVLCCVSRAIPDKGWSEAIEVVDKARAMSGRDIRLILVGNGPVYDEYCRVGAPGFVYLAGFSEDSVGHYAAADMGIMLTKFKSESFPLTIVDCLFAGKPYIASDVGDIRNMLTTSRGIVGEVIELQDWEVPIERAARVVAAFAMDRERYARAAALVEEAASRYRIDNVATQYVRLFEAARDRDPPWRAVARTAATGVAARAATSSAH